MEKNPDSDTEAHRVRKLLSRLAAEFMSTPGIGEVDELTHYIVPRQKALDIGLSPEGEVPDDVDEAELDNLLKNSIEPSSN